MMNDELTGWTLYRWPLLEGVGVEEFPLDPFDYAVVVTDRAGEPSAVPLRSKHLGWSTVTITTHRGSLAPVYMIDGLEYTRDWGLALRSALEETARIAANYAAHVAALEKQLAKWEADLRTVCAEVTA